MMHGQKNIKLM